MLNYNKLVDNEKYPHIYGNLTHKNGIQEKEVIFPGFSLDMNAKPVNFRTDLGPGRRNLTKMKTFLKKKKWIC